MHKSKAEAPAVEIRSEGTALQAANPQAVQPAPRAPGRACLGRAGMV